MMPELKPCPFCGGGAHIVNLTAVSYVRCDSGCCEQNSVFHEVDDAIEAWNRRTAEPGEIDFDYGAEDE